MDVQINYVAVVLAAAAAMIVGWVWYAPQVFGDTWIKLAKINPKTGNMPWAMGSALISSLVMAYVLAHMAYLAHVFYNNSFLSDTLLTAFWIWLGFQVFRSFMHDQFNQRRKLESLIHAGNDLAAIMAMALVIGVMGL